MTRARRVRPPGATTAAGYGYAHQALRARLIAAYVPGRTLCWRCGRPICDPPRLVHLGHDDYDRRVYRGLEHRACNLAAANRSPKRRGQAVPAWVLARARSAGTMRQSRQW